jgi:hypothetical protein
MAELKGRRLALDDGGRPVVDDGGRLVYVDAETGARLDDEALVEGQGVEVDPQSVTPCMPPESILTSNPGWKNTVPDWNRCWPR